MLLAAFRRDYAFRLSCDASVISIRGKGNLQCRQGDLPLELTDACFMSGHCNLFYLLVFVIFWRYVTNTPLTVVSVLLLLCYS
jgi:hypothetical protein